MRVQAAARRTSGFTLVELLIAMAIAGMILVFVGSLFNGVVRVQARENQNVPVQQALRASLEIMAQDFRSSVRPRVVYPGTYVLPAGLSVSDASSFTMVVPSPNATFVVSPPPGYPSPPSFAASRVTTGITDTTVADPSARPCTGGTPALPGVFSGNDYAVAYQTGTGAVTSSTSVNPDNSQLLRLDAVPCAGAPGSVSINHSTTPIVSPAYNPNTYVVKVSPIRYYVLNNTLYRSVSGTPQVVAFNISSLSIQYLPETLSAVPNCTSTTTYVSVPSCTPRSIILTLTATPQNSAVAGASTLTASQTVFLR